jgi:glycosyltransferase involved in cell wall biosynthesis
MKILHILKGLGLAGTENHLMRLLPGLRAQGWEAELLLWATPQRPADDIMQVAQANGIPIDRWMMPRHLDPLFFVRLVRYLQRTQPTLIHVHLVHAETYAIPAARLVGIKHVVVSSHNDDPFRRRWYFRPRNRLLWRWTDKGIAISEHVRQFLIEVEGARPQQVQTIYYGLPAQTDHPRGAIRSELGLSPETSLIGSVCRLIPQKGLPDALVAMSLLSQQHPNLHYALVGEGRSRAELEAQAHELGLGGRVHFLGWRADPLPLMADMDLFLMPSHWEGFGLVLLEAMSQSRPIVGTRVSAIPEIVQDGVTGLLVPPHDPPALARAIEQVLTDRALAERLGGAGRQRLEDHFSPQQMIDQTAALYQAVLKG